jgi:hypothetical protein
VDDVGAYCGETSSRDIGEVICERKGDHRDGKTQRMLSTGQITIQPEKWHGRELTSLIDAIKTTGNTCTSLIRAQLKNKRSRTSVQSKIRWLKTLLQNGSLVNMRNSFNVPEIDEELAKCLYADKPGKWSKLVWLGVVDDEFYGRMYMDRRTILNDRFRKKLHKQGATHLSTQPASWEPEQHIHLHRLLFIKQKHLFEGKIILITHRFNRRCYACRMYLKGNYLHTRHMAISHPAGPFCCGKRYGSFFSMRYHKCKRGRGR